MTKMNMEKYLSNYEDKDIKKEENLNSEAPVKDDLQEGLKEVDDNKKVDIKISKMSNNTVSEMMCGILNKALRIEDIATVNYPDEDGKNNNSVIKDIRIVSTEDINNDLKGTMEFIGNADVVIHNNRTPSTPEEVIFAARVEGNPNIHSDVVQYVNENKVEETNFTEEPIINEQTNQYSSLEVGDEVNYEEEACVVVFKDSDVCVFKSKLTYRKTPTHNYYIVKH